MKLSNLSNYIVDSYERGYRANSKGEVISPFSGKPLRKSLSSTGYFKVSTSSTTCFFVHRFVAYCKFGSKIFDKGIQVRHLNGDNEDNSWNNIDIGSASENRKDIPFEERKRISLVAAKSRRKLSYEEAKQLRKDRNKGYKYSELMEKYNISKTAVSYIINNKTYNNGP